MTEKTNSFERISKEDREKAEALVIAQQTVSEIKELQTAFNQADIHSKEYLESLGDTITNALENLRPLLENQPDVIVDTQSIESAIVKAFTRFDSLVNEIKEACQNIKVPDVNNTITQPDIKVQNNIELDKLEELLRQELPQIFNQLIEAIPVVEPISWEPVSDRLDKVIELLEKLLEKKWVNNVIGGGGGASNIPMVQGPSGKWVVPVGNEDGSPIAAGPGGGGDASAAKQDEQTALLQQIKDNTDTIEVSVGDVDLNTDQIEAKLDTIASQQQQNALTDAELRAADVEVNDDVAQTILNDIKGNTDLIEPKLDTIAGNQLPNGHDVTVDNTGANPIPSNMYKEGLPVSAANPVNVTGTIATTGAELTVNNAIEQLAYNLAAAALNVSTAISGAYLLSRIELNFTTRELRDITITSSQGTKLLELKDDNSLNISIDGEDDAFENGDQITISITQTSGACSVDVICAISKGQLSLGSNPSLGPSTEDIGNIGISDGKQTDAFGRLRVSSPENVHDFKHLFFTGVLTYGNYGNGSVTHDPATSSVVLSIGTTNGHKETHIKHAPLPYQPGRSQLLFITSVFGAAKANVSRRSGFSSNIALDDALFLEQRGTSGVYFIIRSSTSGTPTEQTAVEQANWNLDTLNGAGGASNPSGITLDLSKNNLFVVDYQWLSAGRVRFGFDIGGQIIYCHEVLHANVISTPFTKTPNFRTFWQIQNTGTAASSTDMRGICVAVMSEGGRSINGRSQGASTGATAVAVSTTALEPVLAIRPRLTYNSLVNYAIAILREFSIVADKDIQYQLMFFPSAITGGTWTSVPGNSMMEYNVDPTSITGGQVFDEGFAIAGNSKNASFSSMTNIEREVMSLIGDDSDSVAFVILARNLGTGSASVRASIRWREERQ